MAIGVIFAFSGVVAADSGFAGGDGSAENPYQIADIDQLNAMRNDLSANYILISDIDMSSYTVWEPIGTIEWVKSANTWKNEIPFTGTFDGAGYTIYNFTHLPETKDVFTDGRQADGNGNGLFGYIKDATIQNVRMENIKIASTIMDHNNVGPLVGQIENSSVINCSSVNGSVELTGILWLSNAGNAGGLIGKAGNSSIENCYSNVSVKTHFHRVGGLAGGIWNTNVSNCSADGDVAGRSCVGGLIGDSYISSSTDVYITNSFATGNASSISVPCLNNSLPDGYNMINSGQVGGFIGWISQSASTDGTLNLTYVLNCYSTGNAINENGTTAGGFVGEYQNGVISDCYATGTVYAHGYVYDNGTHKLGYAGGFAGKMANGTIQNSFASNTVTTVDEAGGFVGQMSGGTIRESYAVTNTTAENSSAGGFVGFMRCGVIEECYAAGDVYSKSEAGGFVGLVNDTTGGYEVKINNTYSVCDVAAAQGNAGGFVGQIIANGANISIANSYAAGSVKTDSGSSGGLIAQSGKSVLSNAFFDNVTTEKTTTAGGTGGKGKNTTEMKNISIFENAGWDITKGEPQGSSVWYILEDYSYPLLTAFYPETIYVGNEEQFKMIGTRAYDYDSDGSGQKKFWHTNANYVLAADIDLSETEFEPFGTVSLPFKGNLTNQGDYVISNLKIEKPAEENVGLFSFAKKAVIDGIMIENASVLGDYAAGTFIGTGENVTLIDCAVVSGNISAYQEAGGLIGKTDGAVLTNCSFEGDFVKAEGTYYAGGLIGNAANITVSNSRANVKEVYSENEYAGGLVGAVSETGSSSPSSSLSAVYQSSFTGNVTAGYAFAGGLIGQAENVTVSQSFAKGDVTADTHTAGGLIGALSNGTITESFATTGTVSAYGIAGGLVGFADGATVIIQDGIATNSVHTEEGKAGGLVGVAATSAPLQIKNSFALNEYVNGTADVGGLVGTVSGGSVQTVGSFSWSGMQNGDALVSAGTGIHGTEIDSIDVWDTFDDSGSWDILSKSNWQQDKYRRYLLPILSWQEQPFIAEALYLAPDEMQNLYYVTYVGNGNDAAGVPVDDNNYILNDIVTVMSNDSMVNGDAKFIEWNTESNGKGESFAPGGTFKITGDVILYAQWKSVGTDEKTENKTRNSGSGNSNSLGSKIVPAEGTTPGEGYETQTLPEYIGNAVSLPLILLVFLTVVCFYVYRKTEEDEN
ncbi:GLUG motif-containing protein [Methanimicrococcus hongohii]|uniref:GLUG motif-containing protein n=1 Tax=Methanimicrococcus hongohii TaxID=3028295 RepID=UPI0029304506|nr:GLUG motif-containing protein [Methanimicrococcus sp. Hf6]